MPKLRVYINGSNENPWHTYGLKCNPFPQLAKMEYNSINEGLQALDSDPIPDTETLTKILLDHGASQEFIAICQKEYVPGKRISFTIDFPG